MRPVLLSVAVLSLLVLSVLPSGLSTTVLSRKGKVQKGLFADSLISLEKKKKKPAGHKAASEDSDAPASADSAASGAVASGNATATPTPSASAAPKKDELTPCTVPGIPCQGLFNGVPMPGILDQQTLAFQPGQFINFRFMKGKTYGGVFYPQLDDGKEEAEKKKKKEAEEKAAKAEKERKEKEEKELKEKKERQEKEEKERKERLEKEERKLKETREREEKEEQQHRVEFEKEEAERKRQREREEEEYLRKKESREAEDKRHQREKERDERLEADRKKEKQEFEAREKALQEREQAMQDRIAKLEAENLAQQKKIADELKEHTRIQINKALNEKASAHLLGEDADKWGFVQGAKEAAEDTKQAIEFNHDVMAAVKKEVQEAMAKAFTRGQIKQLAVHRGQVEARQKIEDAYNAGIQAALRKIAQEDEQRRQEDELIKNAKNATAATVTLPDGKVLTSTPAKPLWSYGGRALGPAKWGGICNTGFAQSPVNVYGVLKTDPEGATPLKPIEFSYEPSSVNIEYTNHSIRLLYDRGSSMTANGVTYDLKYVEFHTPSEHYVRGLHFPMEVQLHHFGRENPAIKAVVTLLATEGPKSAVLDLFWENLPTVQGDLENVEGVNFNVADLLPLSRGYFAYEGSSTRPPCTEGVQWFVMSHYIRASPPQIQRLYDITGPNNRPIQVPNDRKIRQYSPEDKEARALEAEAAAEKKAVEGIH